VQWVGEVFHDCIYTPSDIISFSLGLLSIALWMVALFPQMRENYHNKSTEGLSFIFLLQWFLGDSFNLLGCLLTNQFVTQVWTAIYFCFTDVILLGQYFYYTFGVPNSLPPPGEEVSEHSKQNNGKKLLYAFGGVLILSSCFLAPQLSTIDSSMGHNSRILLQTNGPPLCNSGSGDVFGWRLVVGSIISWLSGLTYFFSRIPQVHTNYQRKSVEGLSVLMFICSVCANIAYGLSVLLRTPHINPRFWETAFPYIIGSIGTLGFDAMILTQAYLYMGSGYKRIEGESDI